MQKILHSVDLNIDLIKMIDDYHKVDNLKIDKDKFENLADRMFSPKLAVPMLERINYLALGFTWMDYFDDYWKANKKREIAQYDYDSDSYDSDGEYNDEGVEQYAMEQLAEILHKVWDQIYKERIADGWKLIAEVWG